MTLGDAQSRCHRCDLSPRRCSHLNITTSNILSYVRSAGGAAYGAGYTHKSSEIFGDVKDGISTVSHEAAEGIGALIGAARSGFSSSQIAARPPPPMVTHIYHDKDSGKSSIVTVLVVSGVGLTGYYAVCWWKGWDFFGLSQARTQQMFQSLNDSTCPLSPISDCTLHSMPIPSLCPISCVCSTLDRLVSLLRHPCSLKS